MTARSTRARLMLWYSGVLLFALFFFSFEIYTLLQRDLVTDLDRRLLEKIHGVKTLLDTEDFSALPEELSEFANALPQGQYLQVRTEAGQWLLPQGRPPVFPISFMSHPGESNTGDFRIVVSTFPSKGHTFTVLAAESLADIRAFMLRVQTVMFTTAIPMLLLSGLGGYWVSRRALAPVDAITRAARSISVENLSERLPEPHTGDEIERLAHAWNELLERLEASVKRIQQFTADASHELRTPIALIRSTAELALRRERNAKEYRDALDQIEREAARMTELTEALLALARADSDKTHMQLGPVDVNALVTEAALENQARAEVKAIRLQADVSAPDAIATAHEAGLRRLLRILVDNAMEHTPAGGSVIISTSRENGSVVLSVRDSGDGIPPAALPHIFERFYRADEARGGKGVGLGLSIGQAIAQAHGSQIEVNSEPGKGACFRIALRTN